MLIVTGTLHLAAGQVDIIREQAKKMVQETRKEPGCLSYGFYQDIENPDLIRIYEEWDNEAALGAHFATPHMAAFQAELTNVEIKEMKIVKFEPGEIQPLG